MSIAQGVERRLAEFLHGRDLDVRADAARAAAMHAKLTNASTDVAICAQHGLAAGPTHLTVRVDALTLHTLQSAALEAHKLEMVGEHVMCWIPVLFKGPSSVPPPRAPAPAAH